VDDVFLSVFYQHNVLSGHNIDEIMCCKTSIGRAAEFITLIITRGQRGGEVLLDALLQTTQLDLYDILADPKARAGNHSGRQTRREEVVKTFPMPHDQPNTSQAGKPSPKKHPLKSTEPEGAQAMECSDVDVPTEPLFM